MSIAIAQVGGDKERYLLAFIVRPACCFRQNVCSSVSCIVLGRSEPVAGRVERSNRAELGNGEYMWSSRQTLADG